MMSKSQPPIPPPPYKTDRATLEQEVDVETYRGSGPGGQHRNVTDSAVRLVHRPTGIRVTATESRSQHQNREQAFARLIERLETLNRVPRKRVPTRASRGSVERRLVNKQRRQTVKRLRGGIHEQDL
jgi:protein subunit release factor A